MNDFELTVPDLYSILGTQDKALKIRHWTDTQEVPGSNTRDTSDADVSNFVHFVKSKMDC